MGNDILLEIAIFTFIMVIIGIALSVYEFKKMMKEEAEEDKTKKKNQ